MDKLPRDVFLRIAKLVESDIRDLASLAQTSKCNRERILSDCNSLYAVLCDQEQREVRNASRRRRLSALASRKSNNATVLFVGPRVGKTCALICYSTNAFPGGKYLPRVFDDVTNRAMVDGRLMMLTYCDTPSELAYLRLWPSRQEVDHVVACYACDDPSSVVKLRQYCLYARAVYGCVPITFAGFRIDLATGVDVKQEVNNLRAEFWGRKAREEDKMVQGSALTPTGFTTIFYELNMRLLKPDALSLYSPDNQHRKSSSKCLVH